MSFFTKNLRYEITDGLVGWWKFDEPTGNTAFDSSRTQAHGSLVNSPIRTQNGISFNGSSNYINIGSVLNITGDITLSAWVYLNASFVSGYKSIIGKWGGGQPRSYLLCFSGSGVLNGIIFFCDTGSTQRVASVGGVASFAGRWLHIVAVRNGGILNLFVNNSLNNTNSLSGSNLQSTTKSLQIANHTDNDTFFNGRINNVRIYNRALNPQEISILYKSGASKLGLI